MDDVVNRLARELADVIGSAVAGDTRVEACREKARVAGYEMQLSLEAIIGFGSCVDSQVLTKVETPAKLTKSNLKIAMTANDKRFLRSLRIAADEMSQDD